MIYPGKRLLCYTEISDFTDFQGIGRDPLYSRYDSVNSVVKRYVAKEYQHFLAVPNYDSSVGQIAWYIDEWTQAPVRLTELAGDERAEYEKIKQSTFNAYDKAIIQSEGEDLMILMTALKYKDDERIYCANGKVFLIAWGMRLDVTKHSVIGAVIHEANFVKKFEITFDAGQHGMLLSKADKKLTCVEGTVLSEKDIPKIEPNEGWTMSGWTPSVVGHSVTSDITFYAQYIKQTQETPVPIDEDKSNEPMMHVCRFDAGEHGSIEGEPVVRLSDNSRLADEDIPTVKAKKGYTFKGWDISPVGFIATGDTVFTAQYEKNLPWWRRWWIWLTGRGCLKWLLRILVLLLLLWLLFYLLRSCVSCIGHHPVNGVVPIDSVRTDDGRKVDDNGYVHPVTESDGSLPADERIVAPALGEGGADLPVISQPGVPDVIANRLLLFMEDTNDDIEALAKDFKKAYPDEQYSIIGYDREVKLLVVQIPESERDEIRQTINAKIPNHRFIVFDEEIYELNGQSTSSTQDPGWHMAAIHLQQGWQITKGSPDVKIAVVDDGIEASHPIFNGRIVDAYNVYRRDNHLSLGEGHGTHTAGLAAGSLEFYSRGAAGVAPECKLMPVQVLDNGKCPLSALTAGVMYAVHHDADVVNVSIGPSFRGLNVLPVAEQNQIAKQQFKNTERLWTRVCELAVAKNSILVFAAGNDDILSSIPPENRNNSAIVVTAVDNRLFPTDFTNYGPCSDISAPGKDIYSSYPHNDFKSYDGTSMSAPLVSGTIALMKSLKKDLTVTQARNVLYRTGTDVYGYIPPMVCVDRALEAVQKGDFSEPEARTLRPVPEGEGDGSAAGEVVIGTVNGGTPDIISVIGNDIPVEVITPGGSVSEVIVGEDVGEVVGGTVPADETVTDYEAIRRMIAAYEKRISELKKLLPKE